jgi:hypothetical protein
MMDDDSSSSSSGGCSSEKLQNRNTEEVRSQFVDQSHPLRGNDAVRI